MTIIANLIVCALVLMALAAFWILVCVWLDRDKIRDHRSEIVRGDDPRVEYMQERIEAEDFLRRVEAGVLCLRCLGLGTEPDGDTACSTCGNSGIVPLKDGTYGTYM
jgi:hypothetical protein